VLFDTMDQMSVFESKPKPDDRDGSSSRGSRDSRDPRDMSPSRSSRGGYYDDPRGGYDAAAAAAYAAAALDPYSLAARASLAAAALDPYAALRPVSALASLAPALGHPYATSAHPSAAASGYPSSAYPQAAQPTPGGFGKPQSATSSSVPAAAPSAADYPAYADPYGTFTLNCCSLYRWLAGFDFIEIFYVLRFMLQVPLVTSTDYHQPFAPSGSYSL
jgi:hypothetical protein